MLSPKNLLLLILIPASSFSMEACLNFIFGSQVAAAARAPQGHATQISKCNGIGMSNDGSNIELSAVGQADSVYADGQHVWGAAVDIAAIRHTPTCGSQNNCGLSIKHYKSANGKVVDITGLPAGGQLFVNKQKRLQN